MNIIKIKKKFSWQNRIQEIINKKNRMKQNSRKNTLIKI